MGFESNEHGDPRRQLPRGIAGGVDVFVTSSGERHETRFGRKSGRAAGEPRVSHPWPRREALQSIIKIAPHQALSVVGDA